MSVSEQLLIMLIITPTVNASHKFILGVRAHPQGHAIFSPLDWGLSRYIRGFPGGSAGKESACNVGDLGSNPGLGRSPGEGKGTHSSTLAWRIPWTAQSMGSQRLGHD